MIIFLDIDGVLNSGFMPPPSEDMRSSWSDQGFNWFDPNCVSNLNQIIQATNARIVLSSSWRLAHSLREMREILTKWGVKNLRLIAATPLVPGEWDGDEQRNLINPRSVEIKKWLTNNPDTMDHFVILDDQDIFSSIDMDLHDEILEPNFVQTVTDKGLTNDDAKRAITILNSLQAS